MGRDFRVFWGAYTVSELGTAVGAGALPLVAILLLHASPAQVALVAALSGVAAALVTFPLGPWVEHRRKRPVMVGADLVRFTVLASVPVAWVAGVLTLAQLCLVAALQVCATIVFGAAGGAHLKGLVPRQDRARAAARLEGSMWAVNTVGPAIGGLLVGLVGATAGVAVDAASYLLSALGIRALRTPEPPCPVRPPDTGRLTEVLAGWESVRRDPVLRPLFRNAVVFGGCVTASTPLLAVLMLRDLAFTPLQYGLALGLPCLGGVAGAALTRPLRRRFGERVLLLGAGTARTLWLGLIPLAASGAVAFGVLVGAETLLLVCAGVFNPTFTALRLRLTDDRHLARVLGFWSTGTKLTQPVFVAAAGLLASTLGVRPTLLLLAGAVLASSTLLPWRRALPTPVPSADDSTALTARATAAATVTSA